MNKPVAIPFAWYCAWLSKDNEPVWEQYEECHPASKEWDNFPDKIIPLYTHPVKEEYESFDRTASHMAGEYVAHPVKELTDEEIEELKNALEVCDYKYFGHYEFSEQQWEAYLVLEKHAKAILRKASEK